MPDTNLHFETVLFDLDGTLIDSIRLILDSFHHTLAAHGKAAASDGELLVHVGTPLTRHLAHYAEDPAEVEAMIATYRAWNLAHHDGAVRAFPGAVAAVHALANRVAQLGVVTSKQRAAAHRGLAVAGFCADTERLAPFQVLVGADDVALHKPDPTPLLAALERLGASRERAAYVGDSPHDLAAARAAGLTAVAVGWGPFPRAALDQVGYDLWLDTPPALAALGRAQPARRS